MATKLSDWIKDNYSISVQAEKLKVGLFSGLAFDHILLLDSKKDTLLFVDELRMSTSGFSLFHLNKIHMNGLIVNYAYSQDLFNSEWNKILKPLQNDSEDSAVFNINHIWVNDALVNVNDSLTHRNFKDLNLYLKDINLGSSSHFSLSFLNWTMPNGLLHEARSKKVIISPKGTTVKGFAWKSGTSQIDLDLYYDSKFDSISKLDLRKFKVNKLATLGLFDAWPDSLELNLEASIALKKTRLTSQDFKVYTSQGSLFEGSISIDNVDDFDRWNYQLEAPVFKLDESEWIWLRPLFPFSDLLSSIGYIDANLNLEGTRSQINLQMQLASSQGNLSTDVFIKSDSVNKPIYQGSIALDQFNLAPFLPNYDVSYINANLSVNGKGFTLNDFDTDIDGAVSALTLGSYTYKDIELKGRLQPNYFKGEALVLDQNLELDFFGEVDFSKTKPVMDFTADIIEANLVQLKLYDKSPVAKLSSLVEINLEGDHWSNIEGGLGVYYTTLETQDNYYHFNDLVFKSSKSLESDTLILSSDIADAELFGQIDIPNLYQSFAAYFNPHFPLVPKAKSSAQDFSFAVSIYNSSVLTDLLLPDLSLGDGAHLSGIFNTYESILDFEIKSANFAWKDWLCKDLEVSSRTTKELSKIDVTISKLDYDFETKFENIKLDQIGAFGDWRYNLAWTSSDSIKFDGILKANARINSNSIALDVEQSQFYFADTLWSLNENSSFNYQTSGVSKANLNIQSSNQNIDLSYSKNKLEDELVLTLTNFELQTINPWLVKSKTSLMGKINGEVNLVDLNSSPKFISNMEVKDMFLNKYPFGVLDFETSFNQESSATIITGEVYKDSISVIEVSGVYFPDIDTNNFSLSFDINQFDVRYLESYLSTIFDEFTGAGKGRFDFFGNIDNPNFDGALWVDDLFMSIPYLGVDLKSNSKSRLEFTDKDISFIDLNFVGLEDGSSIGYGDLKGSLKHTRFKDFSMDLILRTDSLLCLNTDAYVDEAYYGKAVLTGDVALSGPFNDIKIDVNARTNKGTYLYIPIDDNESIEELSFIKFIEKESDPSNRIWAYSEALSSKSGLLIDMNFVLTDEAEVNIIFDETLGDKITAKGSGSINIGVNSSKEVYMFGDYTLSKGDYLFTLQNFVNKKFEIESGSQLVWDGKPYQAKLDLTASYMLNTNTINLAPDYNRLTDVKCSMLMTGDLLKPDIEFDIKIPKGDDSINRILEERTNTEEKETQQFLSLLVLNNFMSADELQNTDVDYLSTTLSTGTEVLSNQLSNWMSQFTDRFDLGFKYHPNQGDTLSNKEFELLMNNMKVNDRITFNGNIGTQPAQNETRIIGDFKVEYQLKEDGKLKLLAFRNLEESFQLQDNASNYTTGVGLFYRDEFKDFSDLWLNFLNIFKRKPTN